MSAITPVVGAPLESLAGPQGSSQGALGGGLPEEGLFWGGSSLARVAVCSLNQWALDFEGNFQRICESIRTAKREGARFRVGPELETCGYGCEDHFLENDTERHSWEVVARLLESDLTDDILVEVGGPVLFEGSQYNCRILLFNRRIVLLRPKCVLVDEGGYRESRYFAAWKKPHKLLQLELPWCVKKVTGQRTAPIGIALLRCTDTLIGLECCEELWGPLPPHVPALLQGAAIISNGSSSYHQKGKRERRLSLLKDATVRQGGVYLYANQVGCDGGRVVFDGGSVVCMNGEVLLEGPRFSLEEVVVTTTTVDLGLVHAFRRANPTISRASASLPPADMLPVLQLEFQLSAPLQSPAPTTPLSSSSSSSDEAEEIAAAAALWLWDYLRRSGARGFFLPLSGGADSAAALLLLSYMCHSLINTIRPALPAAAAAAEQEGPQGARAELLTTTAAAAGGERDVPGLKVLRQLEGLLGLESTHALFPRDGASLCFCLLNTAYLGMQHSSSRTKELSSRLAKEVGAYHVYAEIDTIAAAVVSVFRRITDWSPRFESQGGTREEDLALQNIQARIRMLLSYLLAQLLPLWRQRKQQQQQQQQQQQRHGKGALLVVGTGNADETLRGYLTKYDCSSADLNPIGSLSKKDIYSLLSWGASHRSPFANSTFQEIMEQRPSAELRPGESGESTQDDERDMGLSYGDLSLFGFLRRGLRCGPFSMLRQLLVRRLYSSSNELCNKVQHFFVCFGRTRHKTAVLTPALQLQTSTPDDSRFDHRPLVYPSMGWQFEAMRTLANRYKNAQT
ncbi:hypothetical protein Esti_003947 [Eimeria stiedai]